MKSFVAITMNSSVSDHSEMSLECLPENVRRAVERVIKKDEGIIVAAVQVSKNSLSATYTVQTRSGNGCLSLFIKYLKKDNANFGSDAEIYFNNEIVFYGEVVDGFAQLESSLFKCLPRCVYIGREEDTFLLFENLMSEGYTCLGAKDALQFSSARLVLQGLGEMHAYSFAMKDQRRREFEKATRKIKEPVFREETRLTYGKILTHAIHDAFKLAKNSFPKNSVYVEQFGLFALNILDKMTALAEGNAEDEQFKVVTHGDLWLNNILFKFQNDNNVPTNVIFTDFQGCRYASPVHDLMFVLLVGIDKATRENHRDDFIQCYHKALCAKLQELGSDPLHLFPFSALKSQLHKHTRFVLGMALAGLPLFLREDSSAANPGTAAENEDCPGVDALTKYMQNISARKSMRCKNKMLEIIMDVVDQGYL